MATVRCPWNSLSQYACHWLQGLQDCANTLVGSATAGIRGISGGEMKRTAVGIELVTSPTCVFLDEPTSGLDSEIAMTIMRTLRDVASHGRTVALTIHQPNSDITELFDDFLLMAKGRVMYAGELPLRHNDSVMNPSTQIMRFISCKVTQSDRFSSIVSSQRGTSSHLFQRWTLCLAQQPITFCLKRNARLPSSRW
jgi:ABC-type multidrug transport system ATPase subunit